MMALDMPFHQNFVGIIYGTNGNEVEEFLKAYGIGENLCYVFGFIAAVCLVYVLLKQISIRLKRIPLRRDVETALVSLCLLVCVWNYFAWEGFIWNGSAVSKISFFFREEKAPDLKQYYSNPALSETSGEHPQNIVVIWGESFSKSHSSLYGYKRNTNPLLSELKRSGSLFVFTDIMAPATHTIEAFKCLMSTYSSQSNQTERKWYEYVTLPEVLHGCDYKTFWLSNQNPKGMYDNVVAKYAELCDTVEFTIGKFSEEKDIKYDEALLDVIPKYLTDKSVRRCYFIHLIGSHELFQERYPESFDYFKSDGYGNLLPNQRDVIAAYDNSVRYNDSVVRNIIRLFESEESIVIYLSDHGLDLFDSSDSYAAHAKEGNETSVDAAKRIPFMIYTSPLYEKRFPGILSKIEQNIGRHYCTEDLIYTLMHIIGYKFADNDDVRKFSLFQ